MQTVWVACCWTQHYMNLPYSFYTVLWLLCTEFLQFSHRDYVEYLRTCVIQDLFPDRICTYLYNCQYVTLENTLVVWITYRHWQPWAFGVKIVYILLFFRREAFHQVLLQLKVLLRKSERERERERERETERERERETERAREIERER